MNIKKIVIKKSRRNGQYRAYIVGKNGELIFMSEQYTQVANVRKAIKLVDPEGEIPVEVINGQTKG